MLTFFGWIQKKKKIKNTFGHYNSIAEQLVIAGGANFPDALPWDGGTKTWWQTAYAVNTDSKDASWKVYNDFLPEPLGYGVSIQLPEGVLCIGGCNATSVSDKVFLITEKNNQLTISTDWPKLPVPLANATGAFLGNSSENRLVGK